ncbi:unnamed protein product [Adineta ricciae]|uniref:Uncharacterized protein n=1 Tax=Adineta ricciae TaxID=249248 RepID=A0A815TEX5_ADIRI|nr:unnamed protein product [Adineta ricciae]CAF1505535.1 unnamed protein product [Adineta ricciae]
MTIESILNTFTYAGASISTFSPCSSPVSLSNVISVPNSFPLITETNCPSISRTRADSTSSNSSLKSQHSSSSGDNNNNCLTDDEDFNSLNFDSEQDAGISLESDEKLGDIKNTLTSKEISVLLIELRYRHSLTKSCVHHICHLLQLLKVPNAPLSFRNIETLILCAYQSFVLLAINHQQVLKCVQARRIAIPNRYSLEYQQ